MSEISRKDFEIIFFIEFMNINDPKLISQRFDISQEESKEILLDLEKRELIKIEYREGKIYGSQLTDKGKKIFNDDKYMDLKLELGY